MFKKVKLQDNQLFVKFKKDDNEIPRVLKLKHNRDGAYHLLSPEYQNIKYHPNLKPKLKAKKFVKEIEISFLIDEELKDEYFLDGKLAFNGELLIQEGNLF